MQMTHKLWFIKLIMLNQFYCRIGILLSSTALSGSHCRTDTANGPIALKCRGWGLYLSIATTVDMAIRSVHIQYSHFVLGVLELLHYLELTKLISMDWQFGIDTQIETKYARETAQLNPPHRFVPWLVVNNKPLAEVSYSIITFRIAYFRLNFSPS